MLCHPTHTLDRPPGVTTLRFSSVRAVCDDLRPSSEQSGSDAAGVKTMKPATHISGKMIARCRAQLALGMIALMSISAVSTARTAPTSSIQENACEANALGGDSPLCTHAAFVEADARLSDAYQSALQLLGADAKHARAKQALVASQRAWLKFRDADCQVQHELVDEGAAGGAASEACKTDLTEDRIDELQQIWTP